MLSLVIFDGIPKLQDNVTLEVDPCLQFIHVQSLGTGLQLFLIQVQHCFDLNWATDVGLQIMCIDLHVFLGGHIL